MVDDKTCKYLLGDKLVRSRKSLEILTVHLMKPQEEQTKWAIATFLIEL